MAPFRLAVCKCTKIREERADRKIVPPYCNKCKEQTHFLKYWYFVEVRYVNGQRKYVVKCSKSTDRRIAEGMEREALDKADKHVAFSTTPKDKKLFGAVIDDYLEWAEERAEDKRGKGPGKSTLEKSYKGHIMHHIRPFFGHRKTEEINCDLVEEYIQKRKKEKKFKKVRVDGPYVKAHKIKPKFVDEEGWGFVDGEEIISKATIDRELATLSAICKFAVRKKKYMAIHPLEGIEYFRPDNKRVVFLDEIEQIDAYLEECKLQHNPHLYRASMISLFTGLRKGDCLALKRTDIDLKGNQISRTTTKTKADVYIPLFPKFRRELEEWLRGPVSISGYILPAPKDATKCKTSDDDMDFREVCLRVIEKHPEWPEEWKAPFRTMTFHALRHTFATQYLYWEGRRSNISYALFHVSEILGHSSAVMTQRYAHVISRIKNGGADSFVSYFDDMPIPQEAMK